jgi:hypothetical protein
MATRCPLPRLSIPGSTADTLFDAPMKLTEIRSDTSPARSSVAALTVAIPAFATSTSTRPHNSSTRSTAASTSAATRTSAGSVSARPPSRSTSSATLTSSAARRASSATDAPRRPNSNANARPMPLDAPVIKTTLFRQS